MVENRIIIHLGLHKTASTFLQKRFFVILEDKQTSYINLRKSLPIFLNYILYENELQYQSKIALSYFNDYLNKNSFQGKHIIISDEQFCGSPWDNVALRKIYFDRLNNLFPSAKFFLILRKPNDLIESLYLQYIKTGGSVRWERFLDHKRAPLSFGLKAYLDYHSYINYINTKVSNGNFKYFYYEDMKKKPVNFLMSLTDFILPKKEINSEAIKEIIGTKDNKSISPSYVGILILINKLFKSEKQPFLLFPLKARRLLVNIIIYLSNSKKKIIPQSQIIEFCKDIPNKYYE